MSNAVAIVEQDAQSWVKSHPDWKLVDDKLQVSYRFKDFVGAFSFLTRVAMIAEEQNHHPHIENCYNEVTLTLSTHDAGNIVTQKDFDLAEKIEALNE
jgi:4a-hydroxytetrahydrobiopterin dehydratase